MEALGEPVEAGLLVSGSVSIEGSSGEADLAIPISGPKGSGTVFVVGARQTGEWKLSTLEVEINSSGERIDLLEGEPVLEPTTTPG